MVEIRYDPFELHPVYRFVDGKQIESLKVRSMVNERAPKLSEERGRKPQEVSAEAARCFTHSRERQQEVRKLSSSPTYTKLKGELE